MISKKSKFNLLFKSVQFITKLKNYAEVMSAYVTPHPFLNTVFGISAARKRRLITTNKLLI